MFLDWETGLILCLDCAFEMACAKRVVNTNPSDGLVNEPTCGNHMFFLSDFARPLGKPPNDDENISYGGLLARAEIMPKHVFLAENQRRFARRCLLRVGMFNPHCYGNHGLIWVVDWAQVASE